MKVSKCGGEKTAPKDLTWDEMIENEGVYKSTDSRARFIVIGEIVLWHSKEKLEVAGAFWKDCKFIPTDEIVCFELKPA